MVCGASLTKVRLEQAAVSATVPATQPLAAILQRVLRIAGSREARALLPVAIAFVILIAGGTSTRIILTRVIASRRATAAAPETNAGGAFDRPESRNFSSNDIPIPSVDPDLLSGEEDSAIPSENDTSARVGETQPPTASIEAPLGLFALGLVLFVAVLTGLFVFKGFFVWCTARFLGMRRGIEFAWSATFIGFFVSVPILLFAYLGSRSMSPAGQNLTLLAASILGGTLGIKMAYLESYRRSLLADLIAELPTALAASVAALLVVRGFLKNSTALSQVPTESANIGIFALGFWFVMALGLTAFVVRGFFVWRIAQFFGMNRKFAPALNATFISCLISVPILIVVVAVFRSMNHWVQGLILVVASIAGGTFGIQRAYGERLFRSLKADLALEVMTCAAAGITNAVLIAPLLSLRLP